MPLETDLRECLLAMRRIQAFKCLHTTSNKFWYCAMRNVRKEAVSGELFFSPTISQYSPILAESLLFKHKLLILNRSRQRSPNLPASERFPAGLMALLVRPTRLLCSVPQSLGASPIHSSPKESVIITNLD
jgi:hypothetical protein